MEFLMSLKIGDVLAIDGEVVTVLRLRIYRARPIIFCRRTFYKIPLKLTYCDGRIEIQYNPTRKWAPASIITIL